LRLAAAGALCHDSQVDCSLPDDDEDDADYDQNPADDDNDESDKEDDGGGECETPGEDGVHESGTVPFLPEFPIPVADSPLAQNDTALALQSDVTNNLFSVTDDSTNGPFDSLMQLSDEQLTRVWYSNGLDTEFETGESLPSHQETKTSRPEFLATNAYTPSRAASAIPYIWMRHRQKKHYASGFMMVVKVFSLECQVHDPREFTKIFGWTLKVKNNGVYLAYRKIRKALLRKFPNPASRKLLENFQAIIDEIYKVLDDEKLRQMVNGQVAMEFLKKTSFASKVRLSTQEYQESLIVLTTFLLPWVDENDEYAHDDEGMMWTVFKDCTTRPIYNMHLHNMYSVFPNDQGNPSLAKALLTTHRNCIRDHVAGLAAAPGHYLQYNNKLERRVLSYKGSSHEGKTVGKERNMTFARCRSRDWALPHVKKLVSELASEEDASKIKSSTKRMKSSLGKRGSSTGNGKTVITCYSCT